MYRGLVVLGSLALFTAGCGDAVGADAGLDGALRGEGGTDAGPSIECSFPEVVIAGSVETDALANAPSRCGQPDYVWSRDPTLGDVVAIGDSGRNTAALLGAVFEAQGVVLPSPPVYSTVWRQIRYITQARGELVEATALVTFPSDMAAGAESDVVVLAHGTTGWTDGCSASSDIAYQGLSSLLASYGYVVVTPDFIGLNGFGEPSTVVHPYLIGEPTAHASLDAVRAASRMALADRGNVCMRPRVLVYGPSQGGHAALWIERLAPYYARELDMLGTIAAVAPSDVQGHMVRALMSINDATGFFAAFVATSAPWYDAEDRLTDVLVSPWATDLPAALAAGCDLGGLSAMVTTPSDLLQPAFLDALSAGRFDELGVWGCAARESGILTTTVPRLSAEYSSSYAILTILGETDTVVDVAIERAAFDAICADSSPPALYLECAGAGHAEAAVQTLMETLSFLRARAAGEVPDASSLCDRRPAGRCSGAP